MADTTTHKTDPIKTDQAPTDPDEKPDRREMVPKERYDELLARLESAESTLKTIQNRPAATGSSPSPAPGNSILADLARTVAEELGSTPDEVPIIKNVLRITDSYATRMMQDRLAPVLGQILDRVDVVEARSSFADYSDYAEEIETERSRRAAQNQYTSRSELYHVVRGRNVDTIVERAREAATRPATDVGDGTNGVGTYKTGPGQGATGTMTPDELAALSVEERKAKIDDLTF